MVKSALRWLFLTPLSGAHVAILLVLFVGSVAIADREVITDVGMLLNESSSKRPETVQSRKIAAASVTTAVQALTVLSGATEVLIKNTTDVDLCVSQVTSSESCSEICTGTSHDLVQAGTSTSYPIQKATSFEGAVGKVCIAGSGTGTTGAVYHTQRNQ